MAYLDVKQAAQQIFAPDQGSSFAGFAEQWRAYKQVLREVAERFRPFDDYEGEAKEYIESSFAQQKQWLVGDDTAEYGGSMSDLCDALASQADYIRSDVHGRLAPDHPTVEQVAQAEAWQQSSDQETRNLGVQRYQQLQTTSEAVLDRYGSATDIQAFTPPPPPAGGNVTDPGGGLLPDGWDSGMGNLSPGSGLGSGGGAGGGAEGVPDPAELASASAGIGAGDPSVSPASFGGGAGGAGALPLSPAAAGGPSSTPVAPAAGAGGFAPGMAGAGAGGLAGGGGMGGGGMGMAPMGAAGAGGQGGGKAKGGQGDDEALYTEDRNWTEGIIGAARRRKDT